MPYRIPHNLSRYTVSMSDRMPFGKRCRIPFGMPAPCWLLVWKLFLSEKLVLSNRALWASCLEDARFDSTKFSETFRFRKSGVIDTRLSGFLFGQHSDLIAPNFRKRLLSEILVLSNRCVIRTRRQQGAAFRPSLSSC